MNAQMDFRFIVLEILDNWGGLSTFLYCLHVHAGMEGLELEL